MWMTWTLAAIGLWAGSGIPALVMPRRSSVGQVFCTMLGLAGSVLGIASVCAALLWGRQETMQFRGPLPGAACHLKLDALAAFFLLPIFFIGALGSIYGTAYWRQSAHPRTARKLQLGYGLLIASMGTVALAADGISFLIAWEVMALSAFFLMSIEDQKEEVRQTSWLYLLATHAGTMFLFALFALLGVAAGSFEFRPLDPERTSLGFRTAIFLVALVGFGFKAGVMPLHFWLPGAHANAPSHVSAILSGVFIKMGIYGLLRTLMLLPESPGSWGALVLFLGGVSTVGGVLFALGQHDLKRLLAYHSIEDIGIILMGLGLALMGRARGRVDWEVLGLAGCLLHVWNHGLFKSLLFLSAGSVVHSTRTREIDRMGGLAKTMPRTALLFFVGAAAICGLPPLNGFVSELFIYLGLLRTVDGSTGAILAVPALAIAGALALACFVKAYGVVFLGSPRFPAGKQAHESTAAMIIPMSALAICCAAIGVMPGLVVRPLNAVLGQWNPQLTSSPMLGDFAPVQALEMLAPLLAGVIVIAFFFSRRRPARMERTAITWDCGYARPTARMQYTSSSFAQRLVELFRGVLRPRTSWSPLAALFPRKTEFHSQLDDVVLEGFIRPLWRRCRARLASLRVLQQGSVQTYILCILIIVFLLMLFMMPLWQRF
jgi:hydrogenase-4 component B